MNNEFTNQRCFGNTDGACAILNCPDYEVGHCPFFKTPEQLEEERMRCKLRLIAKFGKKVQD